MIRVFLSQDLKIGAWDGELVYIYGNEEKSFSSAFYRLFT